MGEDNKPQDELEVPTAPESAPIEPVSEEPIVTPEIVDAPADSAVEVENNEEIFVVSTQLVETSEGEQIEVIMSDDSVRFVRL